jgi:predicted transposase/invertase (TIGR01784 family)
MAKRSGPDRQKPPPGSKEEGNSFDKIFKENLRELAPGLISAVLKYENYQLSPLPKVKLQTTVEKEPDFLMMLTGMAPPAERILHFEFEGKDESSMDWRMAEYLGICGKVYGKEIEQHLFYLGDKRPKNIRGQLKHTHFTYRYKVHCIIEINFEVFLYSNTPEEVIFAILANPQGQHPEDLIRMILERLVQMEGNSIAIRKFIKQLLMLSKKRNLRDKTIKKVIEMIGYKDYEDDILYIQGLQLGEKKGIEQGIEKGIEQGIEKGLGIGKEEKDITAIRNMLKKNFDVATIAEVLEVSAGFVEDIQKQLLKEQQIADLLKKKNADVADIAKQLQVRPMLVKVIRQHLK